MQSRGKYPAVLFIKRIYEKGVKLTEKVMAAYEAMIERMPGLEKWFVAINPCKP